MPTIASVRMPEHGLFMVRVPDALVEAVRPGGAYMVALDYGMDTCIVESVQIFRPTTPGDTRLPGFQLIRSRVEEDEARIAENAVIAEKARDAFSQATAGEKARVRVPYARLSFGRERLFIRFYAQMPNVDLRRFVNQIQRDYSVQVELWQMGMRDTAAVVGCLGQCGRSACCCSWLQTFPRGLTLGTARAAGAPDNPLLINGTCGRVKCCFAFDERKEKNS